MDIDAIINLPADQLYQKALAFYEAEDFTNYSIYITMAINLGHLDAYDHSYDRFDILDKIDFDRCLEFCEKTKQYPASCNLYGGIYFKLGDYTKAIEYFKISADAGNSDGLLSMGNTYYLGIGVPIKYDLAGEYYMLAFEKGNKEALNSFISLCTLTEYKNENKENIIKYLLKIKKPHLLQPIYGYDKTHIYLLKKIYRLENENEKLTERLDKLVIKIINKNKTKFYIEI